MNGNKKIWISILSLLLALTCLVGCNNAGANVESTQQTTSQITTESTTETNTEPEIELDFSSDPYVDVDAEEFYSNYKPASCYQDAVYRTEHNLLSGMNYVPDQAPVLSEYQPRVDGMLVRNDQPYYIDENTYVVVDAYGEEVMRIYRGGAYITLEEVAAYVYAFGDIPANYVKGKSMSPASSPWGEYLRLNHSKFTGNTKKYPYEPELPDISGCGGDLTYYEIDIGTTGTDCDPSYIFKIYNDGSSITRGAARIVYTRFDKNGDSIIDPNEKFVFYTYNHYNDFQEYLNYYGGWGEIFGNITGGGKISNKYDCNPTPYIPVYMGSIRDAARNATASIVVYAWIDVKAYMYSIAA